MRSTQVGHKNYFMCALYETRLPFIHKQEHCDYCTGQDCSVSSPFAMACMYVCAMSRPMSHSPRLVKWMLCQPTHAPKISVKSTGYISLS